MEETAHILIVDDEPHIREGLSDLLALDGHIVTCAEDGQEGLALFVKGLERDELPPLDTLIIDIKMPSLGGLALMEEVRLRDPEIPIIIITGHGDLRTATRALKNGASDYITKPFEPELVLAAVSRALAISRLKRRVEKAERMANLGAIAAGIADELDGPLNAITRSAEELSKQLNLIPHQTALSLDADGASSTKIPIADINLEPAFKLLETITRSVLHCIRILETLNVQSPSESPEA
ncbi:MAG: response regulator [Anaerolineales bacterium]|nr:response regulator [Anaerolineales bacterium]